MKDARAASHAGPVEFVLAWVERMRARLSDPLVADAPDVRALARLVDQLEADYAAHMDETLSATHAAAESGYTPQNIRLLRRNGTIGDTRRDLPRKPGHGVMRAPMLRVTSAPRSLADDILAARRRAG